MTELLSVVLVSRIFNFNLFRNKFQLFFKHKLIDFFITANINDSAQEGDGDSEIAAIIEDKNYIDSKMGGKDVFVFIF